MIRSRWWSRILLVAGLLVSGTMAAFLGNSAQARSPEGVALLMRDELREVRAALAVCQSTRARVELRFQELSRVTSELRSEIDHLESLDARGVPQPQYDRYLSAVEAFNATIPEWERQGSELRMADQRCRALAEDHNERVEALRGFLVQEGIWNAGWFEPSAGVTEGESEPALDEGEGGGEGA